MRRIKPLMRIVNVNSMGMKRLGFLPFNSARGSQSAGYLTLCQTALQLAIQMLATLKLISDGMHGDHYRVMRFFADVDVLQQASADPGCPISAIASPQPIFTVDIFLPDLQT